MLVVAHRERAGLALEAEHELATLQHRAVRIAEDRNQHLAREIGILRIPVDVEERGIGRCGTVLQHIHPPGVVVSHDRHVVRHDVAQVAHAVARKRVDHRVEVRGRADLRIQHRVVDDVVAVSAARPRPQIGRAIEVADAEGRKIGDERRRVREPELAVKLNAIRCARDRRGKERNDLRALAGTRIGTRRRARVAASLPRRRRRCRRWTNLRQAPRERTERLAIERFLDRHGQLPPPVGMRVRGPRHVRLLA